MSIEARQNEENFLRMRAAIFRVYSTPKTVFTLIFYATLGLAGVTIANNLWTLKWDTGLAVMGALLLVTEALYRPFSAARLTKGAVLGDMYDLALYNVPLPPQRAGEQVFVHEFVDLARGVDPNRFKDWYFNLDRFPQERQALVCQLTNASWDFYLRRRLQLWTLIGLLGYVALLVVLAWDLNLSFRDAVVKVFLPGLPFAFLLLNLHVDSRVAVINLQGLKNTAEQALRAPLSAAPQELVSANQEHLFKHRQTAFPIPNVIHKLLRGRTATQVGECLNALAGQIP
ncbi:S-4TM family putative pore-forming effector [Deinococcus wulumuqiensis]